MTPGHFTIRRATSTDKEAIFALYPMAFPDEDLLPLMGQLWQDPSKPLMLVAERGGTVIAHIVFARCSIAGQDTRVSLLGPLAVHPSHQRLGAGTALIRTGLELLRSDDFMRVLVLGDPAYYGRFGFSPEVGLAPPHPLPKDWAGAWQSLELTGRSDLHGTLSVPACWQDPALWGHEQSEEEVNARSRA